MRILVALGGKKPNRFTLKSCFSLSNRIKEDKNKSLRVSVTLQGAPKLCKREKLTFSRREMGQDGAQLGRGKYHNISVFVSNNFMGERVSF